MGEIVFRPEYSFRKRIGGPLLIFFGGGLLFVSLAINTKDSSLNLLSVFMLFLGCLGTFSWLKGSYIKIIFYDDKIMFVRRFLRPIVVRYDEFTKISYTYMMVGQRRISLFPSCNTLELMKIVYSLLKKEKIQRSQIEESLTLQYFDDFVEYGK